MIKRMIKIRVVGPKRLMSSIVDKLHQLNVIHLVDKSGEGASTGKPMMNAEQVSSALVNVRAIASQLGIKLTAEAEPSDEKTADIIKQADKIKDSLNKLNAAIKDAAVAIKDNEDLLFNLDILEKLDVSPEDLADYSTLDYFIGSIRNTQLLKEKLSKKTTKYLLKTFASDDAEYIALFIGKEHIESSKSILADLSFAPIEIDSLRKSRTTRAAAKSTMDRYDSLIESSQKDIKQLKKSYNEKIPMIEKRLLAELEKAEAPLRFLETQDTFLIWGFIPEKDSKKITNSLLSHTGKKIFIEEVPIGENEKIPTILDNPAPIDSFHFFLELYSWPKYSEIDPTWLFAITFPIFFGFMLGDMGYGLILILPLILLKKVLPKLRKFLNILLLSAALTVFFGAVFGELFGLELYHPIINRNPEHSLQNLVVVSIIMGIIHINIGLIAGIINETRAHGFKHAFMEKGGWIILQIAAFFTAGSYLNIISLSPFVGYGIAALSIFILFKGEGVRGLVEIPSIFGNILSYLRLMAIGLSSVGLATVINDISKGLIEKGGIMIIASILLLVVGHIINLALGILGGFLHSMRLHYVEHFSKFYKGGGIKYKPFGIK